MPIIDVNITNPYWRMTPEERDAEDDARRLREEPTYPERILELVPLVRNLAIRDADLYRTRLIEQTVYGHSSSPIGITRGTYAANNDWDATWLYDNQQRWEDKNIFPEKLEPKRSRFERILEGMS